MTAMPDAETLRGQALVVCETYPTYRKHLRYNLGPARYNGHTGEVPTICGVIIGTASHPGWDTRLPVTIFADPPGTYTDDNLCPKCMEAMHA